MASAKGPAVAGATTKAEREASLVMGTNNSSIVSKRSVELLYYPKPHFFRYFVKKPQRRAPLINRGYWLRMYAIAETVRRFLEEPSDNMKYVLNFGCGFDPLPFQLLSGERSLCKNMKFVDIDYEKLMINKKNIIEKTKEITDVLEDVEFLPDENAIQICSKHYIGIGCDLKNLKKLEEALKTKIDSSNCSILCVAEVSLTYMDVKSADALIHWTSKLSSDVQFCLLEQFFPDGPDHPFASTMMAHFDKLQAPLYSIHHYPSLSDQEKRFIDAGWCHAQARSLWDLWGDNSFISSSRRISLDTVEQFDEWEEFALFASHYFLLSASTIEKKEPNGGPRHHECSPSHATTRCSLRLLPHCPPRFNGQRRYGAVIPDSETLLGHYGGLGRQSRLQSTDVYTSDDIKKPVRCLPPQTIPARMCHTVTTLTDGDCLLIGGRASPATVLNDCWLRHADSWKPVQSLPAPRFRHCATRLTFGDTDEYVLLYGGKSDTGDVLSGWLLWHAESGWQTIEEVGHRPSARFGACMENIDNCSGVLFGGMTQDGIILEDLWTWKVSRRENGSFFVELNDQTERLQAATPLSKSIARFGATVNMTSWGLVIAGGISPRGAVPSKYEIMLLDTTELMRCLACDAPLSEAILSAVGLGIEFKGRRPLLSGHVACAVNPYQVLILGGGAVCFSFGTFWNEGTWMLQDANSASENRWLMIQESKPEERRIGAPQMPHHQHSADTKEIKPIPRIRISTSSEFQEIVAKATPVVIEGSDIGPCTELWSKEYLATKVGSDRKVVVHEAHSEHMNFQAKNFSYVMKEFGTFLDEVYAGSHQYLRSISTKQPSKLPANLAVDFPGLKDDFHLPAELSLLTDNVHSSPLRISGPVSMWLHYDVMANVLCQVRGEKRVILYPPSDVQHLQLPAGASGSMINIFKSHTGPIVSIPHTSPHETVLKPGDILFIPPLWLHATSQVGEVSIAVNVFFRNLAKGYAPGRDVYGNRDLQAYEKGRNDLEKIVRSFDGLPPDMARFYLLRLADELKEKAWM